MQAGIAAGIVLLHSWENSQRKVQAQCIVTTRQLLCALAVCLCLSLLYQAS